MSVPDGFVSTAVEGCGGGPPGHQHTPEGLRLMSQGATHVEGNHYRFGPPELGHWDHPDNARQAG